jgi:synaptobrevin family protein YKT6
MQENQNYIFSISIFFKNPTDDVAAMPTMISSVESLEDISIWKRGSVKEVIRFAGREVVKRTPKGQRQSTEHLNYRCHTYVANTNIGIAVLSTLNYPPRVAHDLVGIAYDRFIESDFYETNKNKFINQTRDLEYRGLDNVMTELIVQYRKPEQVDRISMIQNELDEARTIIQGTLDNLLDRGEKLDDLMNRTSDLSFSTKQFAKRTDDLNKCCTFL